MKGEAAAALWEFDRELGVPLCGLDEAGRGPLAGPVFAACVVLKPGAVIPGLNDSKKLTEKRREAIFEEILGGGLAWFGIGSVSPEEIDRINILQATYQAMRKAIAGLKPAPDLLLNDAVVIPQVEIKQVKIIKGDAKSVSIAAASIVAKVTRDQMMEQYDALYPEYGFAKHKGYGTAAHMAAIQEHGLCPIHRQTFLKKYQGRLSETSKEE